MRRIKTLADAALKEMDQMLTDIYSPLGRESIPPEQLLKAIGREHVSNGATTEPEAEGFNPAQALPGDGAALRNYTRQRSYDQVGNILSLIHTANAGSWNRSYAYATDSNRLSTTTVDSYSHNAHGSFTTMPHLDVLDWDHNEHLSHVKRGTSETWYVYDSAGQRVRKLTEKSGFTEERLYLGGFEIYRKSQSSMVALERKPIASPSILSSITTHWD